MAITKAKKQEILAKLDGIKKDSDSIVFVNFNALPVLDSTVMRAKLRDEGVGFFVAKKTLSERLMVYLKVIFHNLMERLHWHTQLTQLRQRRT